MMCEDLGPLGKRHRRYAVRGTDDEFIAWRPSRCEGPVPLVVYLHGASCRGDDPALILVHGDGTPPRLLDDGDLDLEALVVSPLLPKGNEWAKTMAQAARPVRVVDAVLRDDRLPRVDPTRLYATGPSCGGLGSYTLACRLAARSVCPTAKRPLDPALPPFAAVAPVCGGGSPIFAKLLAATPIWFWHAEDDVVVPVHETDALVEALQAINAPVRPGETPPSPPHCSWMEGHNAWTPAYARESPLWPWLFAQSLQAPAGGALARLNISA
ncbi:hypothetical protein CTAYLR_005925 [Chrysophaeum taylorii]|uniref:Uncharacterized protein n=1 Tax=Chrysophaeum taylorii TaxID=2483200 RepID=A0AAD7UBB8_9STRA|nr:hypothetical protein CTAYLR_005925 [Chrysophaeum taylorii]